MSSSGATVDFACGQLLAVSEIVPAYDDNDRFLGTYITLFVPAGLADATPPLASASKPEPPAAAVEAPAPSPPEDPTDRAVALLKESGLIDGTATVEPPEELGATSGGNTLSDDLVAQLRKGGKYLTFVRIAGQDYKIRNVHGELTMNELHTLTDLARSLLA